MEVRTKEARPVLDISAQAAPSIGQVDRIACNGPLTRIAETAAQVLDVPIACLFVADACRNECGGWHGVGVETLTTFVHELIPDGQLAQTLVLGPDHEAGIGIGGDGASVTNFVAVPVHANGEPAGILCVADYRERTLAEREVSLVENFAALAETELARLLEDRSRYESEERFRSITENAVDLLGVTDPDGTFTYLSPAASAVFGRAPEDALQHSIYDNVYDEDVSSLDTAFQSILLRPGDAVDVEYRIVRSGGGFQHMRLRGRNLLDRPGVGGIVVNIRDVTDRTEFEEEILKSRDRAEEMSRLKSVFLTNMSHEIRTPLTTILGFAEVLADEVDEEQREFVQLISRGGERLMDTLMSILDLARLESSSFDIKPETFDVGEKVWELCHLMEPLAMEKGLRLHVNLPDEPVTAFLDLSAVERAVSALISNGIKFTKVGSVTVTLEADDEQIFLNVADTGIGISQEFMPFLFEEFKQESEGFSRMHEGNGLGLSITKRLVELMKGDIMAESEKGHGTVFTVALPRNGEVGVQSADESEKGGEVRPRVLVVEDNADTRTLVNHLLRKNYEVVCVSDADEALALAAEKVYDVLLVDINLGKGKSGEDVLHAVKALPAYNDTPVIAVTAYAMPGDRERFFSEGFDDYVSKPFSKQRLLEALESVLE